MINWPIPSSLPHSTIFYSTPSPLTPTHPRGSGEGAVVEVVFWFSLLEVVSRPLQNIVCVHNILCVCVHVWTVNVVNASKLHTENAQNLAKT